MPISTLYKEHFEACHFEFSIADGYFTRTCSRSNVKIPYSFINPLIREMLSLYPKQILYVSFL